MNVLAVRGGATKGVHYVNFNQDLTCLSVGAKDGFRVFSCCPLKKRYEARGAGYGIVEMLNSTSLVAVVGGGEQPALSPRTLRLWNTKTDSVVCELQFDSPILAVKMNPKRLIVVRSEELSIFELSTMTILQTLEIARPSKGIVALSPDPTKCYLAFPKAADTGDLIIYDALSLGVRNILSAHQASVAALAICRDGTMLASASDKGTIIRVFALPSGTKLYSYRRGSSLSSISCLSFSIDQQFLVVSGSTATIHVFKLLPEDREGTKDDEDTTPASAASSVTSMLGGVVSRATAAMEGTRSFARVTLREGEGPCISAVTAWPLPTPTPPAATATAGTMPVVAYPPPAADEGKRDHEDLDRASPGSAMSGSASQSGSGSTLSSSVSSHMASSATVTAPPVVTGTPVLTSAAPAAPVATATPSLTTASAVRLTVATADGIVYQYVFDPEVGGVCRLAEEFMLHAHDSEAIGAARF